MRVLLKYLVANELQNLGVAGERLEEESEVSETIFLSHYVSIYLLEEKSEES